ncbi:MAG TPA: hypothetical protein VG738_15445 [Chitinophagaceae bacterium]|nr:hypothetical protein [Chitinophagaceae bacterium]
MTNLDANDLKDSPEDAKKLASETATLNLPDVFDIPGQEHIHVPRMAELSDTTISSSDEEGDTLFNEKDDSDVSDEEKELLERTDESMSTPEDEDVFNAELDKRDDDGELLNESIDTTGEDLDVPGSGEDDADEEIGEEDEENNNYSLGGDDHNLQN